MKDFFSKHGVMIKAFLSIFVTAALLKFCCYLLEGYIYVGGAA